MISKADSLVRIWGHRTGHDLLRILQNPKVYCRFRNNHAVSLSTIKTLPTHLRLGKPVSASTPKTVYSDLTFRVRVTCLAQHTILDPNILLIYGQVHK